MNRLILIGNGFDLAHGLKSGYCDLIKSYIAESINNFLTNSLHSDPLLDIKTKHGSLVFQDNFSSFPDNAIEDLLNLKANERLNVSIKSSFLRYALKQISKINWVDLENLYFDMLLQCRDAAGFDFERVNRLNMEFDFLKDTLEKYLMREQKNINLPFSHKMAELFCEPIKKNDIVTIAIKDQLPKRNLILNFNYTNTLDQYQKTCNSSIPIEINHIHGQLEKEANPIIFGFGDEYNKSYLDFEHLRNKALLTHIKSFGYFKASNYHNLIRFIENDVFQVFILGHSLGLSDRTMLRQIFEHEKCKSIKIFYHQCDGNKNDYCDKTYDISSHFVDKGSMRKKIAPFDLSYPMPQPGKDSI